MNVRALNPKGHWLCLTGGLCLLLAGCASTGSNSVSSNESANTQSDDSSIESAATQAPVMPGPEAPPPLPTISFDNVASLSSPISNNAVALQKHDWGFEMFSFLGLGSGKTHADITREAMVTAYVVSESRGTSWLSGAMEPVPVNEGRLAAAAVTLGNKVILFGGYTVAEDGSEVSTPEVFRFQDGEYTILSPMPVPVDDMVAVPYQDRYVYLISGWHDVGNVNLVQIYDSLSDTWVQGTPYPGEAVFGHAGGIAGNTLVVCDGARIDYPADGLDREFLPARECWLGEISAEDHRRIRWLPLPRHPGRPRYRMAATGVDGATPRIVFAGGSATTYNYNGIGYNGVPALPDGLIFSFNLESRSWECHGQAEFPTMDHRGLLVNDERFYLIGGMSSRRQVLNTVFSFELPEQTVDCP